jgi:RES domain
VAPIDCLYLAEDELTPLMEIAGVLRPSGSPVSLVFPPQVMMTVDGAIGDVLDLTDSAMHSVLGTSHQELTGAWAVQQSTYLVGLGPMPPTQQLGAEAFASSRIAALRYPSSKNPSGVDVMVFPARLVARQQQLTVFNPSGTLQQSLP